MLNDQTMKQLTEAISTVKNDPQENDPLLRICNSILFDVLKNERSIEVYHQMFIMMHTVNLVKQYRRIIGSIDDTMHVLQRF